MAHVMVDPEDLLDHDDRTARLAAGIGAVGGEFMTVRGGQFDRLSHIRLLLVLRWEGIIGDGIERRNRDEVLQPSADPSAIAMTIITI
jgi:hypothetical protein